MYVYSSIYTSIASDLPMRRVHKSRCSFLTRGRIVAAKLHEKEDRRKKVADEALEVENILEKLKVQDVMKFNHQPAFFWSLG